MVYTDDAHRLGHGNLARNGETSHPGFHTMLLGCQEFHNNLKCCRWRIVTMHSEPPVTAIFQQGAEQSPCGA